MTASLKKLSTVFALSAGIAAGVTAGGIIGIGTLARRDAGMEESPQRTHATAAAKTLPPMSAQAASGARIEAYVIKAAGDNILHVRAHTWVAQFAAASICTRPVTAPAPCHYTATVRDAQGNALESAHAGETVYLQDIAINPQSLPHGVALADPAIRPRQDKVAGPVPARVVHITDGDTVEVEAQIWPQQSVLIDIRMGGIDTPEKKGRAKCPEEAARAEKASQATADLLRGQDVLLYDVQYEKYGGRVLGGIKTANGTDAAQNLVRQGLARAYDGGTKSSWCARR
jgi:endonuclease YncB( thermonuclease family)